MFPKFKKSIPIAILIISVLWLILEIASRIFAEALWFREVDYLAVLITRWQTQYGLWLFVCAASNLFLWGNLWLANRLQWRWSSEKEWYRVGTAYLPENRSTITNNNSSKLTAYTPPSLKIAEKKSVLKFQLPLLLTISIISSIAIAILIINYGNAALSVWRSSYRLPHIVNTLKPPLDISLFSNTQEFVSEYFKQLLIIIAIVAGILWKPRFSLSAIATLFGIFFASIWAGNWALILKFFQRTDFYQFDPQFNRDIAFYIFDLPLWQLLEAWLLGLFGFAFLACLLFYLLSGNSLSEGKNPGFSQIQIQHLSCLGTAFLIGLALQHWLNRYQLLYSSRGVVYGAGYTNIKIQLPAETILIFVSLFSALWVVIQAFYGYKNLRQQKNRLARIILLLLPFCIYLGILLMGNFASAIAQQFIVRPNELAKERPYIKRSIKLTRNAFNLDKIEARTFNPQGNLTAKDIAENDLTIENIRLWDTRPILETNRQLQQIRPYYQFRDADIDRYVTKTQNEQKIEKDKQQVIISARELDYREVQDIAKTWVNEHLVYTHGYGFTLSPVNRVDTGGLPYYFVSNIGAETEEGGNLNVSNDPVSQKIPIGKPRIYYGELTNPYIMTSTKVKELDFPSGEDNVYNTYDGTGGIKIRNYFNRILFAEYLKDWQMLFTQNFTPETKLLFRRNIKKRVRAIAPFLNYDNDPYLVVADTENEDTDSNYLYWIIDAYTTSDRYPYSDPGDNSFNYLRNSVKVVVDAYNGNVDFYIADSDDPIIKSWAKIFPNLFKPLTAMPASLRRHIRYPEDLFSTQSERLLTYHMTDPQVFYNREDRWQIPQEIYGAESQPVAPYYLIMKLPTATAEEFILLHPYTPTSRPNLIAWLAARSDGENYGKLLLYKFPKQKLVYGIDQIEALINQDPVISQQISLWNREGSRAIQGNLLVIPIEQSLLYVEPLYIEAEQNSLPALTRVIVVFQNKIVMAETLKDGLKAIFKPQETSEETIIRPLEEE